MAATPFNQPATQAAAAVARQSGEDSLVTEKQVDRQAGYKRATDPFKAKNARVGTAEALRKRQQNEQMSAKRDIAPSSAAAAEPDGVNVSIGSDDEEEADPLDNIAQELLGSGPVFCEGAPVLQSPAGPPTATTAAVPEPAAVQTIIA